MLIAKLLCFLRGHDWILYKIPQENADGSWWTRRTYECARCPRQYIAGYDDYIRAVN